MAMPWSNAITQPMLCQPMSMAEEELVERNKRQTSCDFKKSVLKQSSTKVCDWSDWIAPVPQP